MEQKTVAVEVNGAGNFKEDLLWGRCLDQHYNPRNMSPNTGKSGAKLESLALFIKSLKGVKWSLVSTDPGSCKTTNLL